MKKSVRAAISILGPIVVFCGMTLFATFDVSSLDLTEWSIGDRLFFLFAWVGLSGLTYMFPGWPHD